VSATMSWAHGILGGSSTRNAGKKFSRRNGGPQPSFCSRRTVHPAGPGTANGEVTGGAGSSHWHGGRPYGPRQQAFRPPLTGLGTKTLAGAAEGRPGHSARGGRCPSAQKTSNTLYETPASSLATHDGRIDTVPGPLRFFPRGSGPRSRNRGLSEDGRGMIAASVQNVRVAGSKPGVRHCGGAARRRGRRHRYCHEGTGSEAASTGFFRGDMQGAELPVPARGTRGCAKRTPAEGGRSQAEALSSLLTGCPGGEREPRPGRRTTPETNQGARPPQAFGN